MKVDVTDSLVTVVLNGVEYPVPTSDDNLYDLNAVCVLAGYRNPKRALGRLVKHDYIGTTSPWLESGRIPAFLVKDLIRIAPTRYAQKLLRLFEERVFNRPPELTRNSMRQHRALRKRILACETTVSSLGKKLEAATSELTDARREEYDFFRQNEHAYEFNSDYESDYESTTDSSDSSD